MINVLLVNMPFAGLRPAIGVSLLQGHLARAGIPARIDYANVRFAQRLGTQAYERLADFAPVRPLLGEWVFAPCLFGPRPADDDAYLAMVQARYEVDPAQFAELREARELAEPFLRDCLARVDWRSYDVVGFTTCFNQNIASLALASRLKQRFPHLRILFGGANCEAEMGLQLHRSFPFIDAVFTGEADLSFLPLIQALGRGEDVPALDGVVVRRDGSSHFTSLVPQRVQDLDTLPYPVFDDFFEQVGAWPGVSGRPIMIETSRGCWWGEKHHCTFCGLNGLNMAYRSKSPERAYTEIVELSGRYRATSVQAVDNILDMRYVDELFPRLAARGLAVGLFYETKANLRKEQVQMFARAGATQIQPGIESLSTSILRLMRKGTTALQNVQLLKWCKQYGIAPSWNILHSFPGEDPAENEAMVRMMDAMHHLQPPLGIAQVRLDRFTPYFADPESFGLRNVRPDRSYHYVYDLPADELANLAYYFEFDHADGRDPECYTAAVRDAGERWEANAGRAALDYTDDGVTLTIWDRRPGAGRLLTALADWERDLYLYCDQNHSLEHIVSFAEARGAHRDEGEALLQRLVELRLMATADGRYLSLAIPMTVAERMPSGAELLSRLRASRSPASPTARPPTS